jgi:alpha-N-arabinofuranosidase
MISIRKGIFIVLILFIPSILLFGQNSNRPVFTFNVYPDSVLNDVSNHPVGINLDYFMDDDKYLKPSRRTADALKAMGVKFLRYPGGNKSDFYFFSKPPYEKSEPTLARTGKDAVGGRGKILNEQYNGFKVDVLDFDEFMVLCREIGAEPVLVVAADEYRVDYPVGNLASTRKQLIDHAVEWVRYANIKKNYQVKYWMIGNESWHESNPNSSAEIYAQDVVDFSKAMKAVDPNIHIVPNGNSGQFWKTVLTTAAGYIDDICISNYPVYNYRSAYATYRDTLQDLMGPVRRALKAIDDYASPGDRDKLKLIVAEYGPFDWGKKWPFVNNMGYNLANFEITGEQLLEPRILFSCFWNTRWIENDIEPYSVFDALDKNGGFNANGLGMMIWGNFLGNKMVKTSSSLHIRTFASFVPEEKKLYVYLMNKSEQTVNVKPDIKRYKVMKINQAWELVGTGPADTKPIWRKVPNLGKGGSQLLNGTSIRVIEYLLK